MKIERQERERERVPLCTFSTFTGEGATTTSRAEPYLRKLYRLKERTLLKTLNWLFEGSMEWDLQLNLKSKNKQTKQKQLWGCYTLCT